MDRIKRLRKMWYLARTFGIDEDMLHDILYIYTGKDSFKQATAEEIGFVLDHLHWMIYGRPKWTDKMSRALFKFAEKHGISADRVFAICREVLGIENPEQVKDIKDMRRLFGIIRKIARQESKV